jgi:Asp-tRNA(Asn)/Glu-tRNA(Gln) amidotransferase A subunit family amidase
MLGETRPVLAVSSPAFQLRSTAVSLPERACEIADAVRRRSVSAREVIAAALERIAARNPALNAFVYVDAEGALAQAAAIDAAVARGEDPGPFAGVPIGVKDLAAAKGMPHTFGSKAFSDNVAEHDSVEVARLRAAGAVLVGKTNTPEFGYKGYTENLLFGATGNPWDGALTPGGSSGGSAAAVAAGMTPVCTGSDGGGSIRIPASFCGCYGLKPTAGRIPLVADRYPTWATHSHVGPLSRSVRDAARYLDVCAGPHAGDLHSLDAPAGHFEAAVLGEPLRLARIAWSADLGYATVDPGVLAVAGAAAKRLAGALGAELADADPGFTDPLWTWYVIGAPGDVVLVDGMTDEQRASLEPGFRDFAESARELTAAQFALALQERHALNRTVNAFFEEYDLLLTPTVAASPFKKEGPPPTVIAGKEVGGAAFIPFTYPFNLTGHPAASVPAGLDGSAMPVGLQIVGPKFRDDLVLRASAAYEALGAWPWPA